MTSWQGANLESIANELKNIREILEKQSTTKQSSMVGEWITEGYYHNTICSNCGAKETEFIYGTGNWYGVGESKFCPNCGTKMKG